MSSKSNTRLMPSGASAVDITPFGMSKDSMMQELRKMYSAKLNDAEFATLMNISLQLGANPFKKEIWAVKMDGQNNPASIIIARDYYRRRVVERDDFIGMTTQSVYSNDGFSYSPNDDDGNAVPSHKITAFSNKDRGELLGAYTVIRLNNRKPIVVIRYLSEYYKSNRSTWNDMKGTMIEKVSEAHACRIADPNFYNGTMSEDELTVIQSNASGDTVSTKIDAKTVVVTPEEIEKLRARMMKELPSSDLIEKICSDASRGKITTLEEIENMAQLRRVVKEFDRHIESAGNETISQDDSEQKDLFIAK